MHPDQRSFTKRIREITKIYHTRRDEAIKAHIKYFNFINTNNNPLDSRIKSYLPGIRDSDRGQAFYLGVPSFRHIRFRLLP